MKFTTSIAAILLAVSAAAMEVSSRGVTNWGGDYPTLPGDMTVSEAAAKCGDQAQLSCCNHAVRSGDVTDMGGILKNALGGGSGNNIVEIFDQCSKLDVQGKLSLSVVVYVGGTVLIQTVAILAIPVQDALNQRCKQNVACCQSNPGDAVSLSRMCRLRFRLTWYRATTFLESTLPVLHLDLYCNADGV